MLQNDLLTVDGQAGFRAGVGNVARRDRAVQAAGLTGLADHQDGQTANAFRHPLRFLTALEILRFQLGTLGFKASQVVLVGAQGFFLRQQIVAGEAGLDPHHVAHLPQLFNALEQDQFNGGHGSLLSSERRAAAPGNGRA